jgi:hypothetical protein
LVEILANFRDSFERQGAGPKVAEDLSCELSGWVSRYIPGPIAKLPCVTSSK